MYIKIQTPNNSWDLREAKNIKFSTSRYLISPRIKEGQLETSNYSTLLEFTYGSYPSALNESLRREEQETLPKIVYRYEYPIGDEKFGYAILDDKLVIIFTTEAYIMTDDGKTIDKI